MTTAIRIYVIVCLSICLAGILFLFTPLGPNPLQISSNLAAHIPVLWTGTLSDEFSPALLQAAQQNDIKALQIYIRRGANASTVRNATAQTPLFWAIRHNNPDMVALLLANGASPFRVTEQGLMPIHAALHPDSIGEDRPLDRQKVLTHLLAAGANINQRDLSGMTPLMYAASSHKEETLQWLLEQGADAKIRDDIGRTAADIARQSACLECLKILKNK